MFCLHVTAESIWCASVWIKANPPQGPGFYQHRVFLDLGTYEYSKEDPKLSTANQHPLITALYHNGYWQHEHCPTEWRTHDDQGDQFHVESFDSSPNISHQNLIGQNPSTRHSTILHRLFMDCGVSHMAVAFYPMHDGTVAHKG